MSNSSKIITSIIVVDILLALITYFVGYAIFKESWFSHTLVYCSILYLVLVVLNNLIWGIME
jgi:hypothetical protein